MDRERLLLFWEHLRSFLLSKRSREFLVFLFFLAVSASFWLLQTLHEEYEMELRVPLSLEGIPAGVVITSDLPPAFTVTVRDRGTTLLNYYTPDERRAVTVKFSSHDRGNSYDHVVLSHAELQRTLYAHLLPSSRIVGIRPDTLDYYYTRGIQKRVPVMFRGHVAVNPLYYLSGMRLTPDSVTVWGNERDLDSLQSIPTVVTTLSDLSETKELPVRLAVRRGTKVIPAEVTLCADVDVYTEKQVRVPIVGTNFPAGYALRTFPSSAVISFRVGSRNYKNVNSDNFVLTATYEELMERSDSLLTLHLRSVPEGVSQVRIHPERVQYLIEQTDYE